MDSTTKKSILDSALQRLGLRTPSKPSKPPNPLKYPRSQEPWSSKLFKSPTNEYRGAPLWVWNNKLNKAQLLRQIDYLESMGLGGFHIHVRVGLDTEYLGEEFMELVRDCVEYAEKKGMMACLYDDDRWPSGAAGGLAVKDHDEYRERHIMFTPFRYGEAPLDGDRTSTSGRACRSENGYLMARYDIELDEMGFLRSSKLLRDGETGNNIWYAYLETNPASPWFNDGTYIDTLSEKAMAHFINITHEVYKKKVGDKFGTVVPSIFTDEPQFATKTQLMSPWARHDIFLPWTDDLPDTFRKQYSADLVEDLPQVLWDFKDGKASLTRYRWHDHVCDRFVNAFMDQIGAWCRKNNIILNGHMMEEPTLYSQTSALGEAMRCYRGLEMPGIDLLVDGVEYNTAKQASSVARQKGSKGVMSELYGVTHCSGITFRVQHLSMVSMEGQAKRDYPASINYQSPWYKEYGHVEDHFARVNLALTRGRALTRVGVIHPVESYWLCFGPNLSTDEPGVREQAFADLTNWLLHGLVDFDFISESLLPEQISKRIEKKLQVGECEYDVIIAPNLRTIRSSTLKILQAFCKAGGSLIIAGSYPDLVDAAVPGHPIVFENCQHVFWSQQSILNAIDEYRDLQMLGLDRRPAPKLLYQMREDDGDRYVFVCNTDRDNAWIGNVRLKGCWNVIDLDTFTGNESKLNTTIKNGWTEFTYRWEGCASLLLRLTPSMKSCFAPYTQLMTYEKPVLATDQFKLDSIELSEPNVLMLDYAQYKLNNSGQWSESIEVLRLDNVVRGILNLPMKGEAWKQPWAIPKSERAPIADLSLRFTFQSEITIASPLFLALEDAASNAVHINGIYVPTRHTPGLHTWWVDECITMIPLPSNCIKNGENVLTLDFPFGILTNVERVYVLGAFGVEILGHETTLRPLDMSSLTWGNIVNQGLPFYAGNVTYNCSFVVPTNSSPIDLAVSVPDFSTPVLTVKNLDTEEKIGRIAFQPHTLALGKYKSGKHRIAITAFGNRYNAFGHVHLPIGATNICGPSLWRTGGGWWTDDYALRPIGVLVAPSILVGRVEDDEVDDDPAHTSDNWIVVE